jgi:phosphatidate cytidylyltransferase
MLKQRILTALVLAPLALGAVLWLPTHILALVFGVVLLVGGREWALLSGLVKPLEQLGYVLVLALSLLFAASILEQTQWIPRLLTGSLFWWLFILFRVSRFHDTALLTGFRLSQSLEGILVLSPAWFALVLIHGLTPDGPKLLIFLLLLIWSADIAAYFAGRRWGRVKLAPRVSPGKTREGVYGAMASALLWGLLYAWWQEGMALQRVPLALLLCLVTVLFSVLGDLFESMLKRQRGVKDSGVLLPGHGGMLDRIDSLTAAAPVFLLGLTIMGREA